MTQDDIAALERDFRNDYARGVCAWMRGTMESDYTDTGSRWYHTIVQNIRIPEPIRATGQEQHQSTFRRAAMLASCDAATNSLTGHRTNARRKHGDIARVGCFALPAEKDGKIHLHLWVRVPAADHEVTRLRIKENNRTIVRYVPASLAVFGETLTARLNTTNLWVAATDEHTARYAAVRYCRWEWKREQRMWSAMEYLPTRLFRSHAEVA